MMMRMGFALLGVAVAAGSARGTVMCEKRNGAIFARAACKAKETQIDLASLGAVGPIGPTGPQGPAGAPGAPGASATGLWAVVNSDGTLARGSSAATGTSQIGTGTYQVDFNRDVTGCAYVVTIGDPGSFYVPPAGEVSVTGRYADPNGLYIRSYDSTGASADRALFVAVFCN